MRIFNKFRGTKGFAFAWEQALRFRYMITEEAIRRTRILAFWQKYGFEATKEAFHVSRRTLFLWQEKLKEGGGKLEALNPASRAPKTKRVRSWDSRILEEIKRIRFDHPNLGKEKLYPELLAFCKKEGLSCPKPKTIGRIIRDLGGLHVIPTRITGTGKVRPIARKKVLRKPKGLAARFPGYVISLDTFEEHINGTRRYAITFVLTDNGSEFKKHFSERLESLHLTRYHTRPRPPKQNAHCERFNRTVQDEFANHHWRTL